MKTYIDEEKKICVAVIDLTDEEYDTMFRQTVKMPVFYNAGIEVDMAYILKRALCNSRFVGKAKCAPEDEFDVKKGIELAKSRARSKYYNAMKKSWKELHRITNMFVHEVGNKICDIDVKIFHNDDFQKELLDSM